VIARLARKEEATLHEATFHQHRILALLAALIAAAAPGIRTAFERPGRSNPGGTEGAVRDARDPDGTSVVASLDSRLSTETNLTGDSFVATTSEPVTVSGRTILPAGARIHGLLRDVQASAESRVAPA